MSPSDPASFAIDFTQLKLAVKLPPKVRDDAVDEYSDFAFTKEYKFSVEDPDPSVWTTQKNPGAHHMQMGYPPPPPLVEIQVRTIEREKVPPGAFHVYMDNVCEDFLQFAVAVFTVSGCIKQSLIQPDSLHKGTGVWGTEINNGKIAYIETIRVHPKYQRQGVGRWAIQSLLKSSVLADCPFIFTWATAITTGSPFDPPDPDFSSKREGVAAFWRALGFRRVGGTWFLGYARDAQHPMRSLPAADDAHVTQISGASSVEVILQYNSSS